MGEVSPESLVGLVHDGVVALHHPTAPGTVRPAGAVLDAEQVAGLLEGLADELPSIIVNGAAERAVDSHPALQEGGHDVLAPLGSDESGLDQFAPHVHHIEDDPVLGDLEVHPDTLVEAVRHRDAGHRLGWSVLQQYAALALL